MKSILITISYLLMLLYEGHAFSLTVMLPYQMPLKSFYNDVEQIDPCRYHEQALIALSLIDKHMKSGQIEFLHSANDILEKIRQDDPHNPFPEYILALIGVIRKQGEDIVDQLIEISSKLPLVSEKKSHKPNNLWYAFKWNLGLAYLNNKNIYSVSEGLGNFRVILDAAPTNSLWVMRAHLALAELYDNLSKDPPETGASPAWYATKSQEHLKEAQRFFNLRWLRQFISHRIGVAVFSFEELPLLKKLSELEKRLSISSL